mmetsp:Transcript_43483/g.102468  ORF Transcript_43483/g.102468 Transcript_43483/m.102468 type:complete len:91 (-) Transcript_43483:293-565(-)
MAEGCALIDDRIKDVCFCLAWLEAQTASPVSSQYQEILSSLSTLRDEHGDGWTQCAAEQMSQDAVAAMEWFPRTFSARRCASPTTSESSY